MNTVFKYLFKFFLIYAFILLPFVSYADEENIDKDVAVVYQSEGNDIADIRMELYENGRFRIFVDMVNDHEKDFNLKGKWEREKDNYLLTFRWKKPDLHYLFPDNQRVTKSLRILDHKTFRFHTQERNLYIWGIACKKI